MTLSDSILQQKLARPFRYFPRVASTNDLARSWLMDGAPEFAVVVADEQYSGRGRSRREWRTPPDAALALSIILSPPAEQIARVNMIGAIGVYDLAAQVGCSDIGIKWPNDVQVQGRKISGILVENVWMREELCGVVLGIGVNVRVDFSQTDLRGKAISLEAVVGRRLERAELIRMLLERIEHWYRRIDSDDVHDTWRRRLNMLGKPVVAEGICGRALDVTPDGALLIKDNQGDLREIFAGDVAADSGMRSQT